MNQFTTFETAKLLAENGFPQPNPERGQFWFDENGLSCIVAKPSNESGFVRFFDEDGDRFSDRIERGNFVFAPTASEIPLPGLFMQETGSSLQIFRNSIAIASNQPICDNENHAEAKAWAWLKTNKK